MGGNRAWQYCRAASKENSSGALRTQANKLKCYAKRHNLEIVGGSSDIGNGLTLDRPGLLEFHAAVEDGNVDVLLLLSMSRLGRDVEDVFQYCLLLQERGVRICPIHSCEADLIRHLLFLR